MATFALVDCNNFYASCERIFNPRLNKQPIVVLSNNDGCVIARSNEAKALNIPMGAPFFKWEHFCLAHHVHVFSSNYELYGDISQRVMSALRFFCPQIEIYSIDEAFLLFDQIQNASLMESIKEIHQTIPVWTGMPISIGLGPTKTLAKIANYIAKKNKLGVYDLTDETLRQDKLKQFPVENIWGVGRRLAEKLQKLNIHTAWQLSQTNQKILRKQFSVTMERVAQELNGISCLSFEEVAARKQIISSRSFGKTITELPDLEEAVSHYTAIACAKLRKQKNRANGICVFVQTSLFNTEQKFYDKSLSITFPIPSNDTSYIISAAKSCLHAMYKKGYRYAKAGIILFDLVPIDVVQFDMLTDATPKTDLLMQTIDRINLTLGKNTIQFCAEGIEKSWQFRCEKRSPRYTTRWEELAIVFALSS